MIDVVGLINLQLKVSKRNNENEYNRRNMFFISSLKRVKLILIVIKFVRAELGLFKSTK